jgi:hypothetical protein
MKAPVSGYRAPTCRRGAPFLLVSEADIQRPDYQPSALGIYAW